jgi:hypothetical protein
MSSWSKGSPVAWTTGHSRSSSGRSSTAPWRAALTEQGPGIWNFGFFSLSNGLPESVISGRESIWVRDFTASISATPGVISPQDVEVYAQALRDPARLRASFEYFRAFPTDIADVARCMEEGPLSMPVLAPGTEHSMGETVADLARKVATDVTGDVIADSGHWIAEENPPICSTAS